MTDTAYTPEYLAYRAASQKGVEQKRAKLEEAIADAEVALERARSDLRDYLHGGKE